MGCCIGQLAAQCGNWHAGHQDGKPKCRRCMLRTLQLVLPISNHSTDHCWPAKVSRLHDLTSAVLSRFFPSRFIRQSSPRRQGNNFEGPRCAAASPVAPPRCFTRDEELADTGDRILGRTVDAVYSRDRSAPARPTGHQSPAVVGRLDGAVYLCESHNRPSRNAAAEERERRRLTSLDVLQVWAVGNSAFGIKCTSNLAKHAISTFLDRHAPDFD